MTRLNLILIVTFLNTIVLGQNGFIKIYGTVTDRTGEKLEAFWVYFNINDTIKIRTKTDQDGFYSLLVSKKSVTTKSSVEFIQDEDFYKRKNIKDTTCLMMPLNKIYTCRPYKLSDYIPTESIKELKIDQVVNKLEFEYRFPSLLFQKNTSKLTYNRFEDSLWAQPNEAIYFAKCLMASNPTLIIKIRARCDSDENSKQALSEERANAIKQKLVDIGVNPKRIQIEGIADLKPIISKKILNKAPTKEEKEILRTRNQSGFFSIVSWDFIE